MNGDSRNNDRGLIARIEGRDADALALLYDRNAGRLLGLAHRVLTIQADPNPRAGARLFAGFLLVKLLRIKKLEGLREG
jgi:hypothetical protein